MHDGRGSDYLAVTKAHRRKTPKLYDELTLDRFKERMPSLARDFVENDKKFFVGFGFARPHMNLLCPEDCFERYTLEKGDQYLARKDWQSPLDNKFSKLARAIVINDTRRILDGTLREVRRAYVACNSRVDDILGEILDELNTLGLQNSTIVSFIADHGFHLGENGQIGKNTVHEVSTHVPMVIHIPACTDHGIESNNIVEALDLFPTLVDAAGLHISNCVESSNACTEGTSLMPLITSTHLDSIPDCALSQLSQHGIMKYSLRVPGYRLSVAIDTTSGRWAPEGHLVELYNHENDPYESVNMAEDPSQQAVRDTLFERLKSRIEAAKPGS